MFEMVIGVHDASVSEILQLFIRNAVTLAGKGTAHYIADRILHIVIDLPEGFGGGYHRGRIIRGTDGKRRKIRKPCQEADKYSKRKSCR